LVLVDAISSVTRALSILLQRKKNRKTNLFSDFFRILTYESRKDMTTGGQGRPFLRAAFFCLPSGRSLKNVMK